MIIEVQRFIEFNDAWFADERVRGTRAGMTFEVMIINTEYVATVRRVSIGPNLDFCEVHMADYGQPFTIDKTYEEMRDLLQRGELVSIGMTPGAP